MSLVTRVTSFRKPAEVELRWHLIDADGQVLGRLASRLATILRGKHRPDYTPSLDTGDHIVVINVDKIRVTGRKLEQKTYTRYSGYPRGLKRITLQKLNQIKPTEALHKAVSGMLPHTPLGRQLLTKLRLYTGSTHPHTAQQPVALPLTSR
ncbi:MAG: 50S ribosomal protein L13 [Candidatus Omnitrophica bacterium]|nr:50S ribosomal protein L13 [Candidatus Omnitrophota bacterium]